jgi:hypothetical protein
MSGSIIRPDNFDEYGKMPTQSSHMHQGKPRVEDPYNTIVSQDLSTIVGAPLVAAMLAMKESTQKTVAWIAKHMFDNGSSEGATPDTASGVDPTVGDNWGSPRMLTFQYEKTSPIGMPTPSYLKVPLLIMCPIPSLRLEYLTIDFLCKVNSIDTSTTTEMGIAGKKAEAFITKTNSKNEQTESLLAESSLGQVMAMNVDRRNTKSGTTISKEYSYNIKVKAVQDEIPPGVEKIFEILDSLVKETAGDDLNLTDILNPMANLPGLG